MNLLCGFYCIAFIEYMLTGKTLLGYTTFDFFHLLDDIMNEKHKKTCK